MSILSLNKLKRSLLRVDHRFGIRAKLGMRSFVTVQIPYPQKSDEPIVCLICGHNEFRLDQVLWPDLINKWQLTPDEAEYINLQQGLCCKKCGNNLRSIALAKSILTALKFDGILIEASKSKKFDSLKILEINEAGTLHSVLERFSTYRFAGYPEIDMMAMNLPSAHFDLVIHSDTLEHILDPVLALKECRRILKPGGALCFTVPVVVGRMTRSRNNLPPSYHGSANKDLSDYIVHTEFGADFWTYALKAGFSSCKLDVVKYPSGLSMTCWY